MGRSGYDEDPDLVSGAVLQLVENVFYLTGTNVHCQLFSLIVF